MLVTLPARTLPPEETTVFTKAGMEVFSTPAPAATWVVVIRDVGVFSHLRGMNCKPSPHGDEEKQKTDGGRYPAITMIPLAPGGSPKDCTRINGPGNVVIRFRSNGAIGPGLLKEVHVQHRTL